MAAGGKSKKDLGCLPDGVRAIVRLGSWWEVLLAASVLTSLVFAIANLFRFGGAGLAPLWFASAVLGLGFLGAIHEKRAEAGARD